MTTFFDIGNLSKLGSKLIPGNDVGFEKPQIPNMNLQHIMYLFSNVDVTNTQEFRSLLTTLMTNVYERCKDVDRNEIMGDAGKKVCVQPDASIHYELKYKKITIIFTDSNGVYLYCDDKDFFNIIFDEFERLLIHDSNFSSKPWVEDLLINSRNGFFYKFIIQEFEKKTEYNFEKSFSFHDIPELEAGLDTILSNIRGGYGGYKRKSRRHRKSKGRKSRGRKTRYHRGGSTINSCSNLANTTLFPYNPRI